MHSALCPRVSNACPARTLSRSSRVVREVLLKSQIPFSSLPQYIFVLCPSSLLSPDKPVSPAAAQRVPVPSVLGEFLNYHKYEMRGRKAEAFSASFHFTFTLPLSDVGKSRMHFPARIQIEKMHFIIRSQRVFSLFLHHVSHKLLQRVLTSVSSTE